MGGRGLYASRSRYIPWRGICISLPPVLLPRPLALSQPPSLAPRNYVRNERKAPPRRGREPFPWKATRFIIRGLDVTPDRSQTTFYPEPAAKDRPPRFTREEDPEKSRVYNSRLNFCPCFWRGSIFRLRWIVDSLADDSSAIDCLQNLVVCISICRWIEICARGPKFDDLGVIIFFKIIAKIIRRCTWYLTFSYLVISG